MQYNVLLALCSVHAVQSITSLVLCVCRYNTALVLYSVCAGLYVTGLVLCVCNTVSDQPHAHCMQYNTLLTLHSVYATQLVTSLILSVRSTMHDWPHSESIQLHKGNQASMFVACLEVNSCCLMKDPGRQEATCYRNTGVTS